MTVKPGKIFGFLGPNGAGKTTTIRMMVGLLRPNTGTIRVNGIDIGKEPLKAKAQLGVVPDSPEVYERLTGLEYLNFIGEYSHGMRHKLVLMGALLHDPPGWILDEPLVGLDPRSAHTLKELMAEHARRGRTLFFSTHVLMLEIAERLCDRVRSSRAGA